MPAPAVLAVADIAASVTSLPVLVRRAADILAQAETSAHVLAAREAAGLAYDAAKRAARFAAAQAAHSDLVRRARAAQADALEIEVQADVRLADEYDAAQERGDVARPGQRGPIGSSRASAISKNLIHKARRLRAEIQAHPRALRGALQDILSNGDEPTRTLLRRELSKVRSDKRKEAKPSDDCPFRLIDGRDLRRVSWFDLGRLEARARREALLLAAVAKRLADPAPDTRVGDAISERVLKELMDAARSEA